MPEYLVKDEKGLKYAAKWFIEHMGNARIFTFSGELGAGKTTFIKAVCKEMKVREYVSSPSFALVYEYSSPVAGIIYHFDLYRINDISELYDLGYEDYLYSGNICLIEWPEIASELLPPESVNVLIELTPDNSRKIVINTHKKPF